MLPSWEDVQSFKSTVITQNKNGDMKTLRWVLFYHKDEVMGFRKHINTEQSLYSMPGFSGNNGCLGQDGIPRDGNCSFARERQIQTPAFTPHPCPVSRKHCLTSLRHESTSRRCCCPRLPGKRQLIHTQSRKVGNGGARSAARTPFPS